MMLLPILDSSGSQERVRRKLKRRVYRSKVYIIIVPNSLL